MASRTYKSEEKKKNYWLTHNTFADVSWKILQGLFPFYTLSFVLENKFHIFLKEYSDKGKRKKARKNETVMISLWNCVHSFRQLICVGKKRKIYCSRSSRAFSLILFIFFYFNNLLNSAQRNKSNFWNWFDLKFTFYFIAIGLRASPLNAAVQCSFFVFFPIVPHVEIIQPGLASWK